MSKMSMAELARESFNGVPINNKSGFTHKNSKEEEDSAASFYGAK